MEPDWQDKLKVLLSADYKPAEETAAEAGKACEDCLLEGQTLRLRAEKRGKGKTATIATGLTKTDEETAAIASRLRNRLGTGGSARGGEMLFQGDKREELERLIVELGGRVQKK